MGSLNVASSSEVLCLSLDWSNRRYPSSCVFILFIVPIDCSGYWLREPSKLIVSLSDGNLVLAKATPSYLAISKKWTAHDYEPWIAAWDYWDTNIVFSGGDDFKLKAWDVRSPMCDPTFVNRRFVCFLVSCVFKHLQYVRFDAGITTIQSHPHVEHVLAVGR